MRVLFLIITSLLMTMQFSIQAQEISPEQTKPYLDAFQKTMEIPSGYGFHTVRRVKADQVPALLFRYQKTENSALEGEHFSFLMSEESKQILGFTHMDRKYSDTTLLSKSETEKIARDFLFKSDRALATDLQNLWIERHDEQINVNDLPLTLAGTKYKCYREAQNDYAWVIVGYNGAIMTFERNIKWNNKEHKRITEKWLHDAWLSENGLIMPTEKQDLIKLVRETFVNGALNELRVEEMSRGFHPDFAILIAKENDLFRLPLSEWMNVVEDYKNSPQKVLSGIRNLDYTIEVMNMTGKIAMVKTQFYRNEQLIITDYLSYIKFPEGWKAVAKVSNEHIVNPLYLDL